MTSLEARLRALADDAFPPTPDLATWAVLSAPQAPKTAHGWRWTRRRALLAALAALLIPAGAIAVNAVWPKHVKLERVERLSPLPQTPAPDLGPKAKTIAEASDRAGFAVQALPTPPHAIHVLGDLVTLSYADVVITEVRAQHEPDVLIKEVGPDTTVTQVPPNGFFLSGAPHAVAYFTPDGRFVRLPPRLAGNTLVFERDGLAIRIEGPGLGLARARQLSTQLAPRGTR